MLLCFFSEFRLVPQVDYTKWQYFYFLLLFISADTYWMFLWNSYGSWKCWGNCYSEYLKDVTQHQADFMFLMVHWWALEREMCFSSAFQRSHIMLGQTGFQRKRNSLHQSWKMFLRWDLWFTEVSSRFFGFCLLWFISSSVLFTTACGICSFRFVDAEFYLLNGRLISEEAQFLFLFNHFI